MRCEEAVGELLLIFLCQIQKSLLAQQVKWKFASCTIRTSSDEIPMKNSVTLLDFPCHDRLTIAPLFCNDRKLTPCITLSTLRSDIPRATEYSSA
jgi:hypothetical protein